MLEVQKAEIAAKVQAPIQIKLEDDTIVEGNAWKTLPIDIAKGISKELAKDALVARVIYSDGRASSLVPVDDSDEEDEDEGELWDLLRPLEGDCAIRFYTFEDSEGKTVFW